MATCQGYEVHVAEEIWVSKKKLDEEKYIDLQDQLFHADTHHTSDDGAYSHAGNKQT
jgi:hypothetical protein